jgi:predicted DNA-binding transcriptional regulator YafY
LADAASNALRKVEAVLPERLRPLLLREALFVPDFHIPTAVRSYVAELRKAISNQRKVRITYSREDGAHSERTIWPLGLFYWGRVWTLAAWCELREGFRQFRLDRIDSLERAMGRYEVKSGRTLQDFLISVEGDTD